MFPLKDQKTLQGRALITYILILLNMYVFYLELKVTDIEEFVFTFALIPAEFSLINPLTWYPLLTSQFLHGGWFHILSNIWFLAVFGPNIEKVWGHLKFLAYYLIAGVAAAVLQLAFTTHPQVAILGASGAIAGVLGAYFVYFAHHRITTLIPLGFIPIFLAIPAGLMLIYWFGLQVLGGVYTNQAMGGVAFFAHIGGFLAGIILAIATKPKTR